MKKAQIRAILLGIATRLNLAIEYAEAYYKDEINMDWHGGVVDGAYWVASCEIVQYVYPLIGLDDGLGGSDLREFVEMKNEKIIKTKDILKRLEKLVYSEEKFINP